MKLRKWSEVESLLRARGFESDEIFEYKKKYFEEVSGLYGFDEEKKEEERDKFLFGGGGKWQIWQALQSGFKSGLGEVPDTVADAIELGQKLVPGESETVEATERWLREKGQAARDWGGGFRPSSTAEEIASGLGGAAGTVAAMAPFAAGAAAAIGATPIAGTAYAAYAIPALGFGAYGALRGVEQGPEAMIRGGAENAALGAILGGAGRLTRGIGGSAVKQRLAHAGATGVGTAGFELGIGASPEEAAKAGATMALLSFGSKTEAEKLSKMDKDAGVPQGTHLAIVKEVEKKPHEVVKAKDISEALGVDPEVVREAYVPNFFKRIWQIGKGEEVVSVDAARAMFRDSIKKLNEERAAEMAANGGDLPPDRRQWWNHKMAQNNRYWTEIIRNPRQTKKSIGSKYGIHDKEFGEKDAQLLYEVERVAHGSKDGKNWILRDVKNSGAEPLFFKTQTEAYNSVREKLASEQEISIGNVAGKVRTLLNSKSDLERVAGRRLGGWLAERMGLTEEAKRLREASPASTIDAMNKVIRGAPVGEGAIPGSISSPAISESYRPDYASASLASKNDVHSFMHVVGHWTWENIVQKFYPVKDDQGNIVPGKTSLSSADIFAWNTKPGEQRGVIGKILNKPSDMVELGLLGQEHYSIPSPKGGSDKVVTQEYSSTQAEGFAEIIRRRIIQRSLKKGEKLLKEDTIPDYISKDLVDRIDKLIDDSGVRGKLDEIEGIWRKFRDFDPTEITAATLQAKREWLANPRTRLGETFYQFAVAQTMPAINRQEAWAAIMKQDLSPIKSIRHLMQAYPSSAVAQIARGVVDLGIMPPWLGGKRDPAWGSLPEAIARSGIGKIEEQNLYVELERLGAVAELINKYNMSMDKIQTVYENLTDEQVSNSKWAKEINEKLGQEGLFTQGELLGIQKIVQNASTKYGVLLDGAISARDAMRAKYPNGHELTTWLSKFYDKMYNQLDHVEAGGRSKPYAAKFLPYSIPEFFEVPDYVVGNSSLKELRFQPASYKKVGFIEGAVRTAEDFVTEVAHNRLMNAVHDMVRDQKFTGQEIGRILTEKEFGEEIRTGSVKPPERRVIGYMRGGKKHYIEFADTRDGIMMYRSLRSSGPAFLGNKLLDTIVGGPKRMMVLGVTGANAGFLLVTNPIRDTLMRSILALSPLNEAEKKVFREERIPGKGLPSLKDTLAVGGLIMAKTLRHPATAWSTPWDLKEFGVPQEVVDSYIRYLASGVKGSSLIGGDIRSRQAYIDEVMVKANIIAKTNDAKLQDIASRHNLKGFVITHPIEFVRRMLNVSEDLNRFPEFYKAERLIRGTKDPNTGLPIEDPNVYRDATYDENGKLVEKAVMSPSALKAWTAGAEGSVDFKRSGIYGRIINEAVPFFNPSIQGLDKFQRTLFGDKKPSIKNLNRDALVAAAQMVTVPTVVSWMFNKDEEWYKELPRWEKMLFWHYKVGDTVFRVPVPFEFGITMGTLPMQVIDSIYNDAPELIKGQMVTALKSMLPFDALMEVQVVKPLWEAAANKNMFTGIPIESAAMQRRLPTDRYRESTLAVYKGTAKLAEKLGLPETLQSPVMLEHLTRGYTGSVLHEIMADFESLATLDPKRVKGQGILGRVISRTDRPGQSVQDFYERMEVADEAWNTAKRRLKDGDSGTAAKILWKYKGVLGLTPGQIKGIVLMKDPPTPPGLLKMHQASREMAELRSKQEDELQTELAQKILGRDWR